MSDSETTSPLPKLPPRKPDSHKGTFGHALLIGGSPGMAGSIALAGIACARSGAGLVSVATPAACQPTVASYEPSIMTVALPCDADERLAQSARNTLLLAATSATAIACGPGLGRTNEAVELVLWLYQTFQHPMVVDADGLNALAKRPEVLSRAAGPRVLTPHPGEFARLVGQERIAVHDRQRLAKEFAARRGVTLVLKGHRTFITDGQNAWQNTTGNPGMATGGSGDVLTGVVTALLCQDLSPNDAARLGVYVHGLAGDLAAAELGQVSMIASDLLKYLPAAWKELA